MDAVTDRGRVEATNRQRRAAASDVIDGDGPLTVSCVHNLRPDIRAGWMNSAAKRGIPADQACDIECQRTVMCGEMGGE